MPQRALATSLLSPLDVSDHVDSGLVVINAQRQVERWNRWIARHSGRSAEIALGQSLSVAFGCPLDARLEAAITQVLARNMAVRMSYALHPHPLPVFADPTQPTVRLKQSVTLSPLALSTQERGCLIQINDVTETVRREALLREQAHRLKEELQRVADAQALVTRGERRFSQLAQLAPVGIFEINGRGECVFVNERFCQMTGMTRDDVLIHGMAPAIHPDDRERIVSGWSETPTAEHKPFSTELRLQRSDGTLIWVRLDSTPMAGDDGRTWHIGSCVDITESKQQTLQYEFRANHDPLTGLLNRERFAARLRVVTAGTSAVGGRAAVIYIDLDRFKPINDNHGHAAGDAVLKATAQRLRTVLRTDDQPVRLGGDEFAILIADVTNPDVPRLVAEKVRATLEQPIRFGALTLQVGCSVGYATCPDDATDAEGLLTAADARMYDDKRRRKGER